MRILLGRLIPRAELENFLAPISQMSEREAFESLFFPSRAIARADRNSLIGLKNIVGRALKETSTSPSTHSSPAVKAEGELAPSNPTVDPDARKSGARGSP